MNGTPPNLKFIAAPMVNQSDLPFRILVHRYGATMAYTQMYIPEKLLSDREYLEYHIRDLSLGRKCEIGHPIVAQLCGNDTETIVQAGRKLQEYCDAIDLNLGCPQEAARDGHYGAYLLGQKDWPLVNDIVSAMAHSFTVPVSTKLRLCQPQPRTLEFAQQLETSGASWITLHARTVSARRRRQGAADLSEVKRLKGHLRVPVISNGNVRVFNDLEENLSYTAADGLMVAKLYSAIHGIVPDPVEISLEYLNICREYPGTAISTVQTHIRHFIEFQCQRRPWYTKFRTALNETKNFGSIESLLTRRVERWRGRTPKVTHHDFPTETENELPDNSVTIQEEELNIDF